MGLRARATACWRREGLLGLLDRAWERLWTAVAGWRLGGVLGQVRNCWVLPGLRRRACGGRLNLGCGPDRRPGWINADLGLTGDLHLDVTRRFPFAEGCFALVYSEHLLEHLPEAGAEHCLREAVRVLQPGGLLRLSTPDLGHVIAIYTGTPEATAATRATGPVMCPWKYAPGTGPTPAQFVNDAFYLWQHRHLWDEADLRALLARLGFEAIERCEPGLGSSDLTQGLETRPEGNVILEARKPR